LALFRSDTPDKIDLRLRDAADTLRFAQGSPLR